MIDYTKIGRRLYEQRKYIRKLSQEKMALELNMYQADISNLENAKDGSGISDLYKLDILADYFGISLEMLLFGKGNKMMDRYMGNKMKLKRTKKRLSKKHKTILAKLTGYPEDIIDPLEYECGEYHVYIIFGGFFSRNGANINDSNGPVELLRKMQIFVFYFDEVICAAVAEETTVMHHVIEPIQKELREIIQDDFLRVTDVWRMLNPYWALYEYSAEEKKEEYMYKMFQRMDELRAIGDTKVVYVESIYVLEDYRRLGIFRMCIDVIKDTLGDSIIWLNMEPTAGAELKGPCGYTPNYTVSEIGQINMNASIAERLGFKVDPAPWKRWAEVIDEDGEVSTEIVSIRKCAYYLPKRVRELLKNDGDLVAVGRAQQKIKEQELGNQMTIVMKDSEFDGFAVNEWCETVLAGPDEGKKTYWYAAYQMDNHEVHKFGVSYKSVFQHGLDHEGQLEQYEYLDDAENSEHYDKLCFLNRMVLSKILPAEEENEENTVDEVDKAEILDYLKSLPAGAGLNEEGVREVLEKLNVGAEEIERTLKRLSG